MSSGVAVVVLGAQRQPQKGWKSGRHQRRVLRGWQHRCGTFLLFGGFCSPRHSTASSRYKRGLTLSAAHLAGAVTHMGPSLWMSRLLTRFPFAFSSRSFYSPGYSSQLSLQTSSPHPDLQDSWCRPVCCRGSSSAGNPIEMPAECLEQRHPH